MSEQNQRGEQLPRLVFLNGFPGAGKSTAAGQLARFLKSHGKPAGIITNDHGTELVDATMFQAQGVPTESLQGGELCGRAAEFASVARRMVDGRNLEVIIVEPVSTCVDVSKGLIEPLQRGHGGRFTVAPLSVVVDPTRASQVLLSSKEHSVSQATGVDLIFRAQLAEANLIVINKTDQLSPPQLGELRSVLEEEYPGVPLFSVSAATGSGLEEWFDCLMTRDWKPVARAVKLPGSHAGLGWLNCTVSVSSVRYFDAAGLLLDLASCVQALMQQEGASLLRLKMALKPDHDLTDIAAVSMVHPDSAPKVIREASEPIQRGELVLSVRTEADPELLHSVVNRAILATMEHSSELFTRMQHCEHFRIGKSRTEAPLATPAGV